MIYTDSSKYAIRAMIYLAANCKDGAPIAAGEIAEAEGIPPFYLAKILQDLTRATLLKSARGRGGGFRLTNPPEEVSVYEIVQAAENIGRLTEECILGIEVCSDDVPCPLHSTWGEFRDSFLTSLKELSIADMALEMQRKKSGSDNGDED